MDPVRLAEYERVVTRALLTNEDHLWAEAHALACSYGFSPVNILNCHANVERWLRLHGVSEMRPCEKKAIILIQATVRRWLVLSKIHQQMNMYARLAGIDSPRHSNRAIALQKTLTRAWERIHSG